MTELLLDLLPSDIMKNKVMESVLSDLISSHIVQTYGLHIVDHLSTFKTIRNDLCFKSDIYHDAEHVNTFD